MTTAENLDLGKYQLGWADEEDYVFKPKRGLNEEILREMSWMKGEPDWMLDFRLKSYQRFGRRPMPSWGGDMSDIDFDNIFYYIKPKGELSDEWDEVPESIKNTYEKLGIPEAERKYLAGVTAQYECLRGDVRVYTAGNGLVPIKSIVPGDEVFSLNEETGELEINPVKHAAQTDVRQTYEVTVGSRFARTIVATDNHPVLCLVDSRRSGRERARYERRWKTVGELEIGDIVAVARDLPDYGEPHALMSCDSTPHHFPDATSVDLMWLLGLWLGDGSTRIDPKHGMYRLELAIPDTETELQEELKRVVGDLFGLTSCRSDQWRVTFNSLALVDWVELNGFRGSSHTKRIPEWVYSLPTAQRLAFLAGYVDADGYVSPDRHGNTMSITSANESLLDDTAELARLCGLRPTAPCRFESAHPVDPDRTIVGYRLGLGGDVERVPVRNPRRRERLGSRAYRHSDTGIRGTTVRGHCTDTLGFAPVTEIIEADVAPVYDIEIDGHHNFVAEGVIVHNSEVVYHKNREDLEAQGVLFSDMDTALREYPELVKEYFGKIIPPNDNKFSALNSSAWSGGSFIYVPPGVEVEMPLQAYFRINAENMGQFERTLIIADEGSKVHYIEGCSAPTYTSDSLHSAVVEIVVKPSARVTYTTIQNWSDNVFNLVTKRAYVEAEGHMEWIDGNIGSKLTMKYPAVVLAGPKASGEVLSVAYAGPNQHQDTGAKMIHAAPETTSKIVSKSISKDGGRTSYRGLVRVEDDAYGCKSHVQCDALILDEDSISDTYPYMEVGSGDAVIGHEATVSRVADEQLFYLQSRGLTEEQAMGMIVNGFIEPVTRTLPMEYAVEWSRLIELQMEGSVG
ncbi:MAG: Fe-S cluster assembly protein SufB [Acidimicrobiales bacterium]|nr:Fe-S cluster assembly protein SufB [Acidimicrobiales bacterium]